MCSKGQVRGCGSGGNPYWSMHPAQRTEPVGGSGQRRRPTLEPSRGRMGTSRM